MKFRNLVLGGSFDRLHKGHLLLFSSAFTLSENVTIGLTTQFFLEKYPKSVAPEKIFSYTRRKNQLINLFNKRKWENYRIIPIRHPFGVAHVESFEAIIGTEETLNSIFRINDYRKKQELNNLKIIIIPKVVSQNGEVFSSSQLRTKNIDKLEI